MTLLFPNQLCYRVRMALCHADHTWTEEIVILDDSLCAADEEDQDEPGGLIPYSEEVLVHASLAWRVAHPGQPHAAFGLLGYDILQPGTPEHQAIVDAP